MPEEDFTLSKPCMCSIWEFAVDRCKIILPVVIPATVSGRLALSAVIKKQMARSTRQVPMLMMTS